MSVSCSLHILYTQLPLAMCVARQHKGLHQFLSASSNTRRRGTGRHVECEWEGTEERREGGGGRGGEGEGREGRREVEGGEEQRNIVSNSLGEVVCMRSIAHYSVL